MNKRILSLLICAILGAGTLTGCQLAKEDGAEGKAAGDRLAGVFVTEEHLDLFDMDAYLNDHMDDILDGEAVVAGGEKYNQRIYAQFRQSPFEDSMGDRQYRYDYEFSDLDGILLASFFITPLDNDGNPFTGDGYWSSSADEGMTDIRSSHKTTDTGEEVGMSGTVYVPMDSGRKTFYFNPVYQTTSGEVYLVAGQGTSIGTEHGGSTTHRLKDEIKVTEGETVTEYRSEIEVTIDIVSPPDMVTVLEMSEAHTELSRKTFTPGQFPEEYVPGEGTAYLLVEESGGELHRQLLEPDDWAVKAFYEQDGICVEDVMPIRWPEDLPQ